MRSHMKCLLSTLLLLLIFAFPACAATTYVEGTHVSTLDGMDDVSNGPMDIGFTFPFYGTNYTQFHVTTNGVVSFGGATNTYSNTALPANYNYNYPTVFPFWDDLHPTGSSNVNGYILYRKIAAGDHGNPYGSDVLIVQWTNYGYWNSALVMGTFQVHLVSNGSIVFNYNDLIAAERSYGQSATIGIQESGIGNFIQHSYNTDAGIRSGDAIRFDKVDTSYNKSEVSTDDFWDILLYKDTGVQPPGKPVNPTPSIGATVSLSPTLSWDAADNAEDYRVLVSTNSNLNSPIYNSIVTETSTTISGLSEGTTYYWQVVARNSGGETPSDLWSFNTATNTRTLTYTAGANGMISGMTSQTVVQGGNGEAVTAVPGNGYHFVKWSDESTENPRIDTNVENDISVEAIFGINEYRLTYTAGANGSITGDLNQNVIYGSDGTEITAVPDYGYHFVKWSDESTTNPRTDTNVTANISVTAEFVINQAPSTPGPFTSPAPGQNFKGGQSLTINWGASTDPEYDPVKYDLWFFNGTWTKIGDMLNDTDMEFILPADNTENAMFRVYANDTVANSSARDVTFTIDSIAPVLEISGNPSDWQNVNAEINVSVTDTAIDTVKWESGIHDDSYFDSNGIVLSHPYSFSAPSNGFYTVYGKDAAGNKNVTVFEVTKIDKSIPSIEFESDGNSTPAKKHSTAVCLNDSLSEIQSVGYSWEQHNDTSSVESWVPFSNGDRIYTDNGDGSWFLHIKVTDNAGNVNYSVSNAFVLDNTPPVISWIQKPVNSKTGANITVKLKVTDNFGVTDNVISVDGTETQMDIEDGNYSWNISIPASDSGTLVSCIVYNCTFSDFAGNVNSTGDIPVDVAILPIAAFTANVTRGTAPLDVSFQDTSSGLVENWHWDFDDGTVSTEQNPSHIFGSGNFTVNLTVSNSNGTDTKCLNVRTAENPEYVTSPEKIELISRYGEEMNFTVNSTLLSSFEWFIDGRPLTGAGVESCNTTNDTANYSYCNINTSQYINQNDFFMDVYDISVSVSNESIGRTDIFRWQWTVTNSSASSSEYIDSVIWTAPDVTVENGTTHLEFNTTGEDEKDNSAIMSVAFDTTNARDIIAKVEILDLNDLNESAIDFSKESVYQYVDISFNNSLANDENCNNRTLNLKVINELDGGTLLVKSVALWHKKTQSWESYVPELVSNDGVYSYFVVRNISGFSPFVVTCDYEYPEGKHSNKGPSNYYRLLNSQKHAEGPEESMEPAGDNEEENPDKPSTSYLSSGLSKNSTFEDSTSASNYEKSPSQTMKYGVVTGLLILLFGIILVIRKKKAR